MKTAKIQLRVGTSVVPKLNVTPAEVACYTALHRGKGEDPIVSLVIGEDIDREDIDELNRIRMMFGGKTVTRIFGMGLPRLPETFEAARKHGLMVPLSDKDDTGLSGDLVPKDEAVKTGDE